MASKTGRVHRILLGLLAVVGLLATWALVVEPDRLVVHRESLTPGAWPLALNGLRVVALGDIHAGSPHVDHRKLLEVVDRVNLQHPDLVLLLGDYVIHGVVGGRFVDAEPIARDLGRLRGRLGVFAVLGNHDWWWNGERVRAALEFAGIRALENQAVRIGDDNECLWVAGLADQWTRTPDIEATLEPIPPEDPVLLLSHNPDVFPGVPARVSLTLAGHTHGGQVAIPLLGRPIVPSRFGSRYAAGLIEEGGRPLFVTTGLGTSILPVRFRVPPEIAVLTLNSR